MKLNRIPAILSALAFVSLSFGQGDPPKVVFSLDKPTVAAGGTLTGKVTVTFADGLHGYQNPPSDDSDIPVKVSAPKGAKFTVSTVKYPKGEKKVLAGSSTPTAVYEGTIVIPVTLKAPKTVGATKATIQFDYQECNDSSCFPPGVLQASADVKVVAAKASKAHKKHS
jgi:DsbC/DsbD-like thiol-disulfide interchange protein